MSFSRAEVLRVLLHWSRERERGNPDRRSGELIKKLETRIESSATTKPWGPQRQSISDQVVLNTSEKLGFWISLQQDESLRQRLASATRLEVGTVGH
mmetsp:Transcript_42135/g.164780  ORF Transcript_42135/g.164780 Transcript_42135/m.164780 type:complete len:97 (-) Transcript_42135:518-808(-)